MGYRHSRDDILGGALALALDEGLSRLTFGRVAERLGISDRVVVYYFPTKDDLVTEVVGAMGLQLQAALAAAFQQPAIDHRGLVAAAWPVLTTPEADRVFALFFEANGLAAVGRTPYATLVPFVVTGWIEWLSQHVTGDADRRIAEAEAAIAMVDGLLLLRLLAGRESAERAARVLGVVTG